MELSVITINKNNQEGLERTIESVVSQKFNDYEFIVIDGASSDNSVEIIKKYEKEINYWASEEDTGIYNAMNKGIMKAIGRYCLFINSGDYLLDENTLENAINNLDNNDIIYGNVIAFDSKKNHYINYPSKITFFDLYNGAIPHSGGSFIKRELFEKFGYYSENYIIVSDWEFFIKTIVIGNVATLHLDSYISFFNLEGVSTQNLQLMNAERRKVLENLIPERILTDYDNGIKQTTTLEKNLTFLRLCSLLVKKVIHIK